MPADDAGVRAQRAMQAIRAYFARHAFAADTELGIAQWWLPEMGVDVPLIDVRHALQALVEQGHAERQVLPDGTAVYRAPQARA